MNRKTLEQAIKLNREIQIRKNDLERINDVNNISLCNGLQHIYGTKNPEIVKKYVEQARNELKAELGKLQKQFSEL